MIRPAGFPGVAFGEGDDGDGRKDPAPRNRTSDDLGIPQQWATVDQVHGADVVVASQPGDLGEADGIMTSVIGLPIAIATADCVPIVLLGRDSIAVVHAGWRGLSAGVIGATQRRFADAGDAPVTALVGPHIGPCCYEVGPEVIDAVGGHAATTTDGSLSLDLVSVVRSQLDGVPVVDLEACTMHNVAFHSFRRDGTAQRQVTVAWIPLD